MPKMEYEFILDKIVVEDDGVYKYYKGRRAVNTGNSIKFVEEGSRKELIMSKDTFKECYKRWIGEEKQL